MSSRFSRWSIISTFRMLAGSSVLILSACVFLFLFQNCGFSSDYNALTDSPVTTACTGTTCTVDLSTAGFKSPVSGILIDTKTSASNATTCDSTTCFDVGGFCETGGYPGSYFTYTWTLANGTTMASVPTASGCDANGRFRVLIQVPFNNYDYTQANSVKLQMIVIDSTGTALVNPSGIAQWTYQVTVRTD